MKGAFASVRMDENHPHWQYASARAGKLYNRSGDFRTEFGRDYTRIIHSLAYSRLKHKTQVFFIDEERSYIDAYRPCQSGQFRE